MATQPQITLASSSPYRKACLQRLGIEFRTVSPQVQEKRMPDETPLDMALRLARQKAQFVAQDASKALVIGGDQTLDVDGKDYGKPGDKANSIAQLRELSGSEGVFHCAICVLFEKRQWCYSIPTEVKWRTLSDEEIKAYVQREPSFGSAGSAQLEGLGITLVEKMSSDDPSAILGVPLISLSEILRSLGFTLP